ncbi:MAG: nitroreductase family protein, partial [Candidatus Nitrosopolaris sp.]
MRTNDPFSACEKNGLYKAIFSRRDVRSHFINKEIPNDILAKILDAAHHAPSVGFSQPWNFILIKTNEIREQVKDSFVREREKSVSMLDSDKSKQKRYLSLKLEGILDSAINICVT